MTYLCFSDQGTKDDQSNCKTSTGWTPQTRSKETNKWKTKNKQTITDNKTSNQSDCPPKKYCQILSNYLHGLNTSGSGCSSWEIKMFILRNTNVHPEKYFTWHLNTNWIWCHVAQKSTQFKAFRQRTKSQESAPILGALYQGKDCTKYCTQYCTQYQYLVPFNIDFVPGTYVVPVYLANTF